MRGASRRVFTLLVELRCNSYCIFCGEREVDEAVVRTRRRLGLAVPETTFGHLRERYTLESATAAITRARAEGFDELSFQGGEPTIFPEIVELARRARGLGFAFVGMVTNGRKLADRAFAEALLGAGLDGITISVLGADAETHDALAAAPGSFDAMMAGIDHAVAAARALDRRLVVNANIIVSARSVGDLPRIVRLLGERGVSAGALHLVRFNNLGSDPAVVEALRFDIGRVRPAMAEAMAEADRIGLSLHATDVPLCLQPRLGAEDMAVRAREVGVRDHRYEAPGYARDVREGPPGPAACAPCAMVRSCRFVPRQHLPDDPARALRPITREVMADLAGRAIAAIPADRATAEAEIVSVMEALRIAGEIAGQPDLGAAGIAQARARLGALLAAHARRRDGERMMNAFCGLLGLRPPSSWQVRKDAWDLMFMPLPTLVATVRAVSPERAPPGPRVWIGERFAIAIEGEMDAGGVVAARSARPIVPRAATVIEQVERAIFLAAVAPRIAGALRVRATEEAIEVDRGEGFAPVWFAARPGALWITPG